MIDVERSILVERPASDVFAFVSDLTHEPRFHTDVAEAKAATPGPVGVGSVFELTPRPGAGPRRAMARVTRLDPDREIEFETQFGEMRVVRAYRVQPEGGATRVHHRLVLDPPVAMKLVSFVMRRSVAKRWDRFLANLKAILEEPSASGP